MIKVNKAKIRRDIVTQMVINYVASGRTYSCNAELYRQIEGEAMERANELDKAGIVLSKSSYSFNIITLTAGMFSTDVAKILYERAYPKNSK